MELTLQDQMQQFFLSCGMGFILGFCYELFRIPRLILNSGRRAVFIQDVLFFAIAAVLTFLFSLAVMDGKLRFYLFLGEFLGFTSYYFTLGKIISKFTKSVIYAILLIWNKMWEIILYPFRLLYKFAKRIIKKPIDKLQEIFKNITTKILSFFKKCLKGRRKVLYNQLEASENLAGTAPRVHKKGKRR